MDSFLKSFNELTDTYESSHRIKNYTFLSHVDHSVGNFYLPYDDHLSCMIFDRSVQPM